MNRNFADCASLVPLIYSRQRTQSATNITIQSSSEASLGVLGDRNDQPGQDQSNGSPTMDYTVRHNRQRWWTWTPMEICGAILWIHSTWTQDGPARKLTVTLHQRLLGEQPKNEKINRKQGPKLTLKSLMFDHTNH